MAMEDETGTELLTHKASWVPDTPIKPIPPRTEPICKDMHGSPPGSGGSSYSEEFPPGFGPPDELFSCGSRLNYFELGDNSSWPSGPPVTRQPFMKLLALADPTVIGNGPSSASAKYCSTNFNHAAQNTDGNLNHPANAYDVNLSPKARADATSDGATPHFAPITPDKALGVQSRMAFDNHDAKRLVQEGNEYLKELLKVQATDDESMIRTPQQKPRRKKHRPKVVSERKPRRTPKPSTPKSALTEGETRVRRKYVRRKGIEKQPSTLSTEVDEHSSRQNRDEPFKKSCKRALDFDSEQQQENGTIADQSVHVGEPKVNDSHTQVQWPNAIDRLPRGIEVEARDAREGIADELNHSISQKQREGMTIPKSWDPRMVPSAHFIQQEKAGVHCSVMSLHGGNQANSHASPNDMWTKKTSSQNTTFVTEAEQLTDLKRKYSDSCGKIQNGYANMSGIQFNSIQAYESISWLHSPNAYKRRRAEDVLDSAASATSSSGVPNLPQEKEMQFQDKQQVNDCILDFSQAGRSAKRRSNGLARVQNSAPLTKPKEYCVVATHPPQQFTAHKKLHNACTSMQALLLEMNANRSRKKRAKKNPLIHSSYSTPVSLQPNGCVQGHTDQYHGAFTSTPGQLPEILLQHITPVDAIANLLEDLDINKDSRGNAFKEQKALIPYGTGNPEHQNMLVLYSRDGTIVPYDPDKRRQPRPKVDLDEETNRVWKLLLEDINSQGVDGTDEEKARWWQEERRVFKGRTDSFIARMHLVQGDRRFSPWKGSVLDSVVGVFLTQNVSDHLSSSAFMSLAAQFPNKQMQSKCFEEGTSSVINEPLDLECTSKWIEKMSSSPVCDRSSVTVNDTGNTDELEVVNSDESRRGSSGKITSKNDSKCHFFSSNSSGNEKHSHPTVSKLTMDIIKLICDNEDRKAEVDVISSQDSAASCQSSQDIAKAVRNEIRVSTSDNSEIDDLTDMRKLSEASRADGPASFMELLNWASAKTRHEFYEHESGNVSSNQNSRDGLIKSLTTDHGGGSRDNEALNAKNPAVLEGECSDDFKEHIKFSESYKVDSASSMEDRVSTVSQATTEDKIMTDIDENPGISLQCDRISTTQFSLEYRRRSCSENHSNQKSVEKCASERVLPSHKESTETNTRTSKAKTSAEGKARKAEFDWDSLRRHAEPGGSKRPRSPDTMDSINWESVRCADVNEIAQTIKDRGMNNVLAGRIQDFLNRLVKEHGSLDLEWLRDVPPDKAKEFLLSFRGLGLKSVECVRLLTLHHLAFPVDTNVGRIAVRLGWVPLQPLPESLQLHLLELYPILESIQKYLWPRLCKLDQRTLYELHYQMITFGKVFCTKSKPNCNACPMRGECRHFASAFASARLALPGPEQTSIVCSSDTLLPTQNNPKHLLLPPILEAEKPDQQLTNHGQSNCQPIIEEPASPGPEYTKIVENDEGEIDMEDFGEIPTIKLNIEEFTQNLQNYMQQTMELQEGDMSKALVALTPEAASLPAPKLKNVSRLRTEHLVYEIPDGHPLLNGLDKLEPDDPSKYLLAIWTPGETANSVAPPEQHCNSRDHGTLCNVETCFACRCIREENSHTVRGTILIPCRTAMRGSFPLNGTYFQVNEVFADHESSLQPIDVPRDWLWKLQRRTVYFGTSIPAIFKGLSTEGIQHCFWRGYVCVRGFDRQSRAPRPLMARLHFPASKMAKFKGKPEDES